MTTGRIGGNGAGAAGQGPPPGGEEFAGARNWIRSDPVLQPPAAAQPAPVGPQAQPGATPTPGPKGLVPTVLELPGQILGGLFGGGQATGRNRIAQDPATPGPAPGPAAKPAPAATPAAGPPPPIAGGADPGARNWIAPDTGARTPGAHAAPATTGPAVTSTPIGPAAPQAPAPGGGDGTGARNWIRADPAAPGQQQGLVPAVLELPGQLLTLIAGPRTPASHRDNVPAVPTAPTAAGPAAAMGDAPVAKGPAMTSTPIGPAAPQTPAPGGEDWAGARNWIRADPAAPAPAPAAPAPAAGPAAPAAAGKPAAPGQQQGLVPAVLELPGQLLTLIAGPRTPASHQDNAAAVPTALPAAGPAAAMDRRNAMTTDPIGGAGPAPQAPAPSGPGWGSAKNWIREDPGYAAPAPAQGPAAPAPAAPGLVTKVLELPKDVLQLLFGSAPQQALGLSPQAYGALAAERPWQVASRLLGAPGTLDAAAFAQIEAMPGPLGPLLRAGAEPRAALAVQERWVALNREVEQQSGLTLLPSHQSSGLASGAGDARAILGTTPRAVPAERLDLAIMALGGSRVTPLAADAAAPAALQPIPATATAVVAVPERSPVAVSREIAEQIALPAPIPLGAGLTMQRDAATGAVIVGFEAAGASQVLGPLAPQVAAALAPALADALSGVQGTPRGIDISVGMTLGADGMPVALAVSGRIALPDGTMRAFGAAPGLAAPAGGPTAMPSEMPATAVLHLSGGADAGSDSLAALLGPYVEYMRPTPVPLDLVAGPGADAAPNDTRLWRMDDTRVFVALGTAGATEALLEAARLHRSAVAGSLRLEELPPGRGFETWDGSLLSLGLAGIRKTSVAAAEETPSRVRALHLDNGTWRASRGPRDVATAAAGEELRLFLAYGMEPAHAAGRGPQGGLAEQARAGFADALLQMERVRLAWWLPPGEVARRQEVWAGVAREWAGTLAGIEAAGPPVLPEGVPPADAIRAIAAQQGSAAAWAAFQSSGLDLSLLLDGAGGDRAAVAEALAAGALLGAGRLGVPADRATGTGAAPTDLALTEAREAFLHAVLAAERGELPKEALEAALAAYGDAALAQLTSGAPLPHGDQGALAARLGHAAQTDIDRGYLAPYLRIARPADVAGAREEEDQSRRQARA